MKIVFGKVENMFFFSNNVFERLLFQGRKKSRLCGKELHDSKIFESFLKAFSVLLRMVILLIEPVTKLMVSLVSSLPHNLTFNDPEKEVF